MKKTWWIIFGISIIITVIGLATGKYFFLFLILPLGLFGFERENNSKG